MAGELTAWIRFTHRLNVLLWASPLPRPAKVRLEPYIYRNPPLHGRQVLEAVKAVEAAGVEIACAGGWGVDALAGKQLRIHRDLDAIIPPEGLDKAMAALAEHGYEEWYRITTADTLGEGGPAIIASVVLRNHALRVVDLILIENPREVLNYVQGSIDGQPVVCLSPDDQVRSKMGLSLKRYRKDRQVVYRMLEQPAQLQEAEKKPD
ncbi:MAG TPA: hypothetical protein VH817_09830 [Thermoleophilaceae bacterium]|jgi:lincosamide nucleotidyltransferase A/C/D/E